MITKAYDSTGSNRKIVNAKDAKQGKTYYCPLCNAPMYRRMSKNGTYSLCLFPGHIHHSKDCSNADANAFVIRDESQLDPTSFLNHLMRPSTSRKDPGHHTYPPKDREPSDEFERILSPSSLAQLYGNGIDKLDPNTPVKGGKKISDILLTFKQYRTTLDGTPALGKRALELRPMQTYKGTIKFSAYWTRDNGQQVRRCFELVVPDPVVYQKAVLMLFNIEGPFLSYKFYNSPKYKLAVIAADWTLVSNQECETYCSMCRNPSKYLCLGAVRGTLINMQQIYCPYIPEDQLVHSD